MRTKVTKDIGSLFYELRRLSEIAEAEKLLSKQVWYNRHQNSRMKIENGEHQLVSKDEYMQSSPEDQAAMTIDTVWEKALEAAERTEDEVGIENLGPWDDFEWGMINGKLSALRWVLFGDDWDTLDT